ncbi:muramoyltetrapeptide carboxypeptidase [Saccharothrix tamanrassetensis]|uniref:Muramoyltetrapeptide carboxypeptidase n=1 Tax=Saccharothrix tamanrassetensis TaxID=1051531 RepID=A0A841CCJ5_9PSEU|nr:LD-carboxypeptidase [Saccharothrix tamanrassetensis]MBB5953476.1 muramoyltetrapeptide carboxypeptidase [Saccharothrix tamanrassetensis]
MTPRPLRAGDRVTVVSPAGPVPAGLLQAGVSWLTTWGLDVRVAPHALDMHPTLPYLAGSDADRARDFEDAWCAPDTAAVLCARGGYGSQRIVDLVDWDLVLSSRPKAFVGSSDITALHEPLWHAGVPTWFGPMIGTGAFVYDPAARDRLRRALFEGVTTFHGVTVAPGTARGVAVGGNVSLLGAPPPDGAIAWLEDVGEEPYRLDRMLTSLLRGDWFADVAGIVLGSWTDCGDVADVLHDRLGGLGVPIIGSVPFGHCAGQHTVPFGVTVELDADAGVVKVLE